MSENNGRTTDFLVGAFVGALTGASLALLFAPKSGRELRGDITVGSQKAVQRANDLKEAAQTKGIELKDKAVVAGNDLKDKASSKTSEITQTVANKTRDLKDNTTSKLNDIRKKEDKALETAEQALEEVAEQLDDTAKKLDQKQ